MEINNIKDMSKEELLQFIEDLSKRWLAHDGLWFQAAESKYGIDEAIELDRMAWERFTVIEANRIKKLLDLPEGGGLKALARALDFRLYAFINKQEIVWEGPNRMIFKMTECRVQAARRRKNMPDFPCKSVGIVEYSGFAKTIDKRIKTKCLACPPDEADRDFYCGWEFSLDDNFTP